VDNDAERRMRTLTMITRDVYGEGKHFIARRRRSPSIAALTRIALEIFAKFTLLRRRCLRIMRTEGVRRRWMSR